MAFPATLDALATTLRNETNAESGVNEATAYEAEGGHAGVGTLATRINAIAEAANHIEEALGVKLGNVDTANPSQKTPLPSQRTVLQQFQSGHGFEKYSGTGTLTDDTEDFVVGKQSMKLTTLTDESQSKIRHKTLGTYDLTGKDLRVTFKVENLAQAGTFEIYLSSDNLATNNVHYRLSSTVQPFIADGEWASVTLSWGDLTNNSPAGAIDRTKINYIEFRCEAQLGQVVKYHINEVSAVPAANAGVACLCFDDGWGSTYERARPFMDTFGYRGTSCIIRDAIGTTNYMTLAQVRALQDKSGWDICAHADTLANHNAGYGTLEDSVVEGELKAIKRWLIENGFRRRDQFMWPKGSFTASQQLMAKRFFNVIRGTTGGKGGSGGAQETFPPADNTRIRTFLCGGSTITAAEVESALTECKASGTMLVLSYHKIVASGAAGGTEMNQSVFEEHMNKVSASGVTVKTLAEAMES